MGHLPNDHKDCPSPLKNSHKLCNEMGHPALSLMEIQWKPRQYDQNFPMKEKPL